MADVKRKHRMPRAAVHLGQVKGMTGDQVADAMTLGTYGAAVRAEERRNKLAVPESTYWPCAPFSISIEELGLLLDALARVDLPGRLQPLRKEIEEAYILGSAQTGTAS